MSKGRHYVFPDEQGGNALDPRLLLVEFNSSILLHQSQVRYSAIRYGSPLTELIK